MGAIKTLKFKITDKDSSYNRDWKVNIERYESAQDTVQDCRERKMTSNSFDNMSTKGLSKGWEGVGSYDEALALLKNGYQPTVDKMQSAFKSNRTSVQKRISFQNEIQGFAPVVPLALKGVPNSMVNMSMKPMKVKVIDIYYDACCTSSTSPETMIQSGQKLLSAIIGLETQGYRFNLYAVQTYNGDTDSDVLCVKVKDSNKPLDLKRISFPLTHPAFFRVIGFDWYSKMPIAKYRCGYGRPLTRVLEDKKLLKQFTKNVFGDNAIYISSERIKSEDETHIKEALINV